MKLLLAILLLSIILVSSTVLSSYAQTVSKGQITIDKAITKSTSWDSICDVGITTGFNQSLVNVYHKDVNRCNGNVTNPTPVPTPTDKTTVCLVGDLKGSTVPNMMKNCNYKIGLGDLGYASDLSYFKGLKFDRCLQGNHESANEDGTASIEKETQGYCGDSWSIKVGQSALLFGFNTNGNLNNQLTMAKQVPMTGIKTVFVLTHKPCYTSPNSHHPVESNVKAFCDSFAKIIPIGVKIYYIAGHNHQLASTMDGTKFVSGGGGKSHYDCGVDQLWNFCNNKSYGYLEATIDNNNGNVATKFIS